MSIADTIAIDKPPPRAVRDVLRRARQRYHAARVPERPALDCPSSLICPLSYGDMLVLRGAGYWPLPPEAIRWIAESPRTRARRRRRHVRHIADVAAGVLAAELPAALAYLQRRGGAT